MIDFLPKPLRDELAAAERRRRRRGATHTVHVGDEAYAILRLTGEGFAVDAQDTPPLRGLIDIFAGPRHEYQALIVASERNGDLMVYEFKRNTATQTVPPVDFERASAPALALPRL